MAELTDREKKIIIIVNTIANPNMEGVPFEVQKNAMKATLNVLGITWDDPEITDLVHAINAVYKETHQSSMKALGRFGHLLKSPFKV